MSVSSSFIEKTVEFDPVQLHIKVLNNVIITVLNRDNIKSLYINVKKNMG